MGCCRLGVMNNWFPKKIASHPFYAHVKWQIAGGTLHGHRGRLGDTGGRGSEDAKDTAGPCRPCEEAERIFWYQIFIARWYLRCQCSISAFDRIYMRKWKKKSVKCSKKWISNSFIHRSELMPKYKRKYAKKIPATIIMCQQISIKNYISNILNNLFTLSVF